MNTTCQQFNQQFRDTYRKLWCSGNSDMTQGTYCGNVTGEGIRKCENKEEDCDYWAKNGECKKSQDYMLVNCPMACGQCSLDYWLLEQENTQMTDPH